jgi:carbamoyl-phosphate synthase large subunit
MKTILVSGASGIVGYGVLRSLMQSSNKYRLVAATIYEDSVAQGFSHVFELAPRTDGPHYTEWLIEVIKKHQVNLMIPGIEADLYHWNEHQEIIRQSGTTIALNKKKLVNLCMDKWNFFQYLKLAGSSLAIPSTLSKDYDELVSLFGTNFLLKPRRGFASKGIVKVRNQYDFMLHLDKMGDVLMAQKLIGKDDEEFTISAFCDGNGGFYSIITLKRKLSSEGFTDKSEVVGSAPFIPAVKELCTYFKPIGPTNFQFRKENDQLQLLEINPRVSSSTSIRTAFGYNESLMTAEYYLDHKTPVQPEIKWGRAVRYTEDFIYYEDRNHF